MTPTTDAIRQTVLIGFRTVAEQFAAALDVEIKASDEEILGDFEKWLNTIRAEAYHQALLDVQTAINDAVPVDEETILNIVNPYLPEEDNAS